jgi:hypothetical protein
MTTTINYTVFKIQEIQDQTSGLAHNNITYETNEFSFNRPLSEKKYISWKKVSEHIALKIAYPSTGQFAEIFEWHLN